MHYSFYTFQVFIVMVMGLMWATVALNMFDVIVVYLGWI